MRGRDSEGLQHRGLTTAKLLEGVSTVEGIAPSGCLFWAMPAQNKEDFSAEQIQHFLKVFLNPDKSVVRIAMAASGVIVEGTVSTTALFALWEKFVVVVDSAQPSDGVHQRIRDYSKQFQLRGVSAHERYVRILRQDLTRTPLPWMQQAVRRRPAAAPVVSAPTPKRKNVQPLSPEAAPSPKRRSVSPPMATALSSAEEVSVDHGNASPGLEQLGHAGLEGGAVVNQ